VYQPVPHRPHVLPTRCGPYRNSCCFDHSSICIFCVSQVKLRLQMAMPCFKLLLVVPGSVHVRCVVQKWHSDAFYIQLFLSTCQHHFTNVPCSSSSYLRCCPTGNLPKRGRQTVGRICTSTSSSFGRHTSAGPCSVPGTLSLSLSWYVRLDVCSEVANGLGI